MSEWDCSCRYVRQREAIMVAARLGCQACMLLCSLQIASARGKMAAPQSWPAVIAGDIMASVLQLGHLPIGFQVCHRIAHTSICSECVSAMLCSGSCCHLQRTFFPAASCQIYRRNDQVHCIIACARPVKHVLCPAS